MRSIYTMIQYVCINDYIDYSFWGLIIGIITLTGGTGLAIFLYIRTEKNAKKRDKKYYKNIIKRRVNQEMKITD